MLTKADRVLTVFAIQSIAKTINTIHTKVRSARLQIISENEFFELINDNRPMPVRIKF